MQRYPEIDTTLIYQKVIDEVIKEMTTTTIQNGYSEDTIKKIRYLWNENLKKAPRSKFAHIVPFKMHQTKVEVPEPVVRPPSPKKEEPKSSSESRYSSDEFSEEEPDPVAAEFHAHKKEKEEEAKKSNTAKIEESQLESDDDWQDSDEETNLEYPEPTGIIHCLHEGVKRKGNDWTSNIKAGVYQELGKGEVFFKSAQMKFSFIEKKNNYSK